MIKVHVALKSGTQAFIQFESMSDVNQFHAWVLNKSPAIRRWKDADDSLIVFAPSSVEMYKISNDYLKRS